MRAHLLQAQAATGVEPVQLRTPQPPLSLRHLLSAWNELASGRQHGFGAPQPITWSEIKAWAQMTGARLCPWEARILRRLDECWMSVWNAEHQRRAAKKSSSD